MSTRFCAGNVNRSKNGLGAPPEVDVKCVGSRSASDGVPIEKGTETPPNQRAARHLRRRIQYRPDRKGTEILVAVPRSVVIRSWIVESPHRFIRLDKRQFETAHPQSTSRKSGANSIRRARVFGGSRGPRFRFPRRPRASVRRDSA